MKRWILVFIITLVEDEASYKPQPNSPYCSITSAYNKFSWGLPEYWLANVDDGFFSFKTQQTTSKGIN